MRWIQGWRRTGLPAVMCAAVLTFGMPVVQAADPPVPAQSAPKPVSQADDGLPSAGGVLFGFFITIGLVVAALLFLQRSGVLQRGLPGLFKKREGESSIRPIERVPVSPGMIVHLVEVDGVRVVIAEGRGAVGMTVLPATRKSETGGQ